MSQVVHMKEESTRLSSFQPWSVKRGGVFRGAGTFTKITLRAAHLDKEETAIWRGKQKIFYILHVKVINMKFVMSISAQIDK